MRYKKMKKIHIITNAFNTIATEAKRNHLSANDVINMNNIIKNATISTNLKMIYSIIGNEPSAHENIITYLYATINDGHTVAVKNNILILIK